MALSENGPQTQSQLVKIEGTDHSTIAKSLSRMESAGLISRRPSKEDRRATIVSLTAKGTAIHKKIRSVWHKLERVTTSHLEEEQREQLVHSMQSVEKSILDVSRDK